MTLTKTNKKESRVKKAIAVIMCLIMAVSCCGISVAAATTKSVSESGNVFVDDWEKTKSWDSGSVKIKYGYNTWWTDEDYCKSYNANVKHTAFVSVGGKKDTASGTKENWSSKAELPHKSGTVTWGTTY